MPPSPQKEKSDDIVVFAIVRDSVCAECGEELGKGRWLRMERERPLCLSCAEGVATYSRVADTCDRSGSTHGPAGEKT